MAGERSSLEDLFAKSLGVGIAVGALAVGVATAIVNQERARQVRADVQSQLDDLNRRIDELSVQANKVFQEKRPEIEDTIARSRQVVMDSLEKARSAVEQSAERAQEYVQKAAQKSSSGSEETDSKVTDSDEPGTGAETRDLNRNGNGTGEGPH